MVAPSRCIILKPPPLVVVIYYELKIGSWYTVDPVPKRQWPSRYKQRIGQLEALRATAIEYYSDTARAPEFSDLVWGTGCRRLADRAKELIFVADGAKWIWNIVDENFPDAVQILDWYHAVEYLTPIAHALLSEKEEQEKWLHEMKTHLWFSRAETVIDACLLLGQNPRVAKVALEAVTYYSNNLNRMDYVHFRNQGYLIGSGTIESGCKQIGTMRYETLWCTMDKKRGEASGKSAISLAKRTVEIVNNLLSATSACCLTTF